MDFDSLLNEASANNERQRTNLLIPSRQISQNGLHVWVGPHYDKRSQERLNAESNSDFKNMMIKFANDPISKEVENMEVDSQNASDFCLFSDRNLGVAITKTSVSLNKKHSKFEDCYLIKTLSDTLFPYSNQVLYRVPDEGECRRFTEEDRQSMNWKQQKAFTRGGRGI